MTAEQKIEGDNFIQCCSISSTSDVYNYPFVSKFAIKGRRSYRSFPNSKHTFPGMFTNPENFSRITSRLL